jgi:hypothetical protein
LNIITDFELIYPDINTFAHNKALNTIPLHMADPHDYYQQQIAGCNIHRNKIKKKERFIPYLRILFFVGFIYSFYKFITGPDVLNGAVMFFSIAAFLATTRIGISLIKQIRRLDLQILINQNELKALKGDFSAFDPGNEFINHDHPYTHDLDIFGAQSLFNCINRTSTIFGKRKLAGYMSNSLDYSTDILQRQEAVKELSAKAGFRQETQLIFRCEQTSVTDPEELNAWLQYPARFKNTGWIKAALYLFSVSAISCIFLAFFGLLSFYIPLFMILIQFAAVSAFGRKITRTHHSITKNFRIIEKYAKSLALIERTEFISPYLLNLRSSLNASGNSTPSHIIARLASLLNWMDSNLNILVSALLNGLLMFNIHMLIAIDHWKSRYGKLIPVWFDTLAELDALSSLANFSFNHPSYTFPVPVHDDFTFISRDMGHPLIEPGACVTNSVEIRGWKQFVIVTGANMSGKSTFLRTIGINSVLAQMGAPVFASSLMFFPVQIHSSIRTNDSLAKRESYFFAELKRLKKIIDELEQGHPKFILLDEILKGTNTRDKQTGSIALIKQLLKYRSAGIFATHDLALGGLIDHYPGNINNLCFEISITGDKMDINYKLGKGICKNLNATYLMKNMGILIDPES